MNDTDNKIVYVVEYLPADILLCDKGIEMCKWQVRPYRIDRETNNFIWLTVLDERIRPDRQISHKYNKNRLRYFSSKQHAVHYVKMRLLNEYESAKQAIISCEREIELFNEKNKIYA